MLFFSILLTKGVPEAKYTSPEKKLLAEFRFVGTQTDSQRSGHPNLSSVYLSHAKDSYSHYCTRHAGARESTGDF